MWWAASHVLMVIGGWVVARGGWRWAEASLPSSLVDCQAPVRLRALAAAYRLSRVAWQAERALYLEALRDLEQKARK